MPLPDITAITKIRVEVDDPIVGITPLRIKPTITNPVNNQVIPIAYDENPETTNVTIEWTCDAGWVTFDIEISNDPKFPLADTVLIEGYADVSVTILAKDLWYDNAIYIRVRAVDGNRVGPWCDDTVQFTLDKETLKESLEQTKLQELDPEEQVFQTSVDNLGSKKITVTRGPMKATVAVDEDDKPTQLTGFLKDGDMWYDETDE